MALASSSNDIDRLPLDEIVVDRGVDCNKADSGELDTPTAEIGCRESAAASVVENKRWFCLEFT
jgi:hypothetical protein